MHACIAALSQGIPAISLAYSKKFAGVFETVNVEQLIVDMRYTEAEEALNMVLNGFEQRNMTAERLKTMIPKIQQQILNMLVSI
jgi:colanic acid/amylovoran biosynthesis protein